MNLKIGLWLHHTIFVVSPTTAARKKKLQLQRKSLHLLGASLKCLVGTRCGYSPKPQDFPVDYDPFEDFFGLGIDMKTRKQAESNEAAQPSYGEYKREVPCPVCRGRGYVQDSAKGMSICTYCVGKCVVLEDSVRESAWETAQTRSPLKVEDDEALDKVDPEVVKRAPQRVHGPHSEAVRKRISRTMKELERRTGAISKRARRQHQDPVIHAQMVAAIKRAKRTEAARKKVSEKQKLFFQNPENRRKRGLQMQGVKFFCKHCGKEGHRRHFCPDLGYVKKNPVLPSRLHRCSLCKEPGHQRPRCPNKDRVLAGDPKPRYKPRAKGTKRGIYKCGYCQQVGHTRRSCPQLQKGSS